MRFLALTLIVATLAIPYAMWVSKTDLPEIDWKALEKNLTRVVAQQAGLDCVPQEITANLIDLCKKSAKNWIPEGIPLQKPFADLFLICRVTPGQATVQIEPYTEPPSDRLQRPKRNPAATKPSKCAFGLKPQTAQIFHFNGQGALTD